MNKNWNFQRDMGFKPKTLHGRAMNSFWNNTLFVKRDYEYMPQTYRGVTKVVVTPYQETWILISTTGVWFQRKQN